MPGSARVGISRLDAALELRVGHSRDGYWKFACWPRGHKPWMGICQQGAKWLFWYRCDEWYKL